MIEVKIIKDSIRPNPGYHPPGVPIYVPGEVDLEGKLHYQEIRFLNPFPKYVYEYENPVIPCSECDCTLTYKEWEATVDEVFDDEMDDFILTTICPICGGPSVPYWCQRLEDVIGHHSHSI